MSVSVPLVAVARREAGGAECARPGAGRALLRRARVQPRGRSGGARPGRRQSRRPSRGTRPRPAPARSSSTATRCRRVRCGSTRRRRCPSSRSARAAGQAARRGACAARSGSPPSIGARTRDGEPAGAARRELLLARARARRDVQAGARRARRRARDLRSGPGGRRRGRLRHRQRHERRRGARRRRGDAARAGAARPLGGGAARARSPRVARAAPGRAARWRRARASSTSAPPPTSPLSRCRRRSTSAAPAGSARWHAVRSVTVRNTLSTPLSLFVSSRATGQAAARHPRADAGPRPAARPAADADAVLPRAPHARRADPHPLRAGRDRAVDERADRRCGSRGRSRCRRRRARCSSTSHLSRHAFQVVGLGAGGARARRRPRRPGRAGARRAEDGAAIVPAARLALDLWNEAGQRLGTLAALTNVLPGRYSFGITGRSPAGADLEPGALRDQDHRAAARRDGRVRQDRPLHDPSPPPASTTPTLTAP